MNISKLFKNVGTQLSIARTQMSGAPDGCTAHWSDDDFSRWERQQKRAHQRHARLHRLYDRIGGRITKALNRDSRELRIELKASGYYDRRQGKIAKAK